MNSSDPERIGPGGVHWLVSSILDSSENHRQAGRKPYSVGPILKRGGGIALSVSLLDDTLRGRFESGVWERAGHSAVLDRAEVRLDSHKPFRVVRKCSWLELFEGAKPRRSWRVKFVTPCFRRVGNESLPFPLPGMMADSLRDAWFVMGWPLSISGERLASSPEGGMVSPVDLDGVVGSDGPAGQRWPGPVDRRPSLPELVIDSFRGGSKRSYASGRQRVGFVGEVTYRVSGRPEVAELSKVDRLMRLAPFSGVGSMTSHGFGAVELAGS